MKKRPDEEALRWFTQAKDEFDQYYILTRYPNDLPGGVLSRYFDDPLEAEEAMLLARNVVALVEGKLKEATSGAAGR